MPQIYLIRREDNTTNISRFDFNRLLEFLDSFVSGEPQYGYIFIQDKGVLSSMADLTVKDTEPDPTATAQFLDADGNPTSPDDTPQWASSDTSVANVTANPDGLSAAVVKTGKTGATLITCTSTRSSDGTQVVLSATLTVAPSEETSGELTLSAGSAPGTVQPAGTTAPDTSGGVTVSGPGGTTTTDPNAPAPTDPNAPAQPVDPNAPAPTTGDTSAATPNP